MRFTDRVVALHPAVVTVVFLLLFIGGGLAVNIYPFGSLPAGVIFSVTMLLMMGPVMLWHYSLYRAASERNADSVGHNGRRAIFFVLTLVALSTHLILFPTVLVLSPGAEAYRTLLTTTSVAMLVGCLSYFGAIWAAANALTRYDDRTKTAEFHKTLGTFILEVYLPIGIWVIYPRIKRMLAAPVEG